MPTGPSYISRLKAQHLLAGLAIWLLLLLAAYLIMTFQLNRRNDTTRQRGIAVTQELSDQIRLPLLEKGATAAGPRTAYLSGTALTRGAITVKRVYYGGNSPSGVALGKAGANERRHRHFSPLQRLPWRALSPTSAPLATPRRVDTHDAPS